MPATVDRPSTRPFAEYPQSGAYEDAPLDVVDFVARWGSSAVSPFHCEPGRTLVVYRAYVDAGTSVPKFVQDFMIRRSIPNLLRATKKRIESGGTWKK